MKSLVLDMNLIEFLGNCNKKQKKTSFFSAPCTFRHLTKLTYLSMRQTAVFDLHQTLRSLLLLPHLTVKTKLNNFFVT